MPGPFLRKYGVGTTLNFVLFKTDGVDLKTDAVHASGDTTIMKDEGAEANTASGFTDEGQGYSIPVSATEMEAARIVVYVVDQTSPKVWLDTALIIETYGHASAMHALDLDTALNDPTAATIADAVWDELSTGHVSTGKAGQQLWTNVDAILADTGTNGVVFADGAITAAKIATDAITAAKIAADAIGLSEIASAVIDAINAQDPGAGAITFTYTLTSDVDSSAIPNASVWVTSDIGGATVLASGTTDGSGQVTFYLDAGTVYIWRQKPGWNFTNPDTETVS